MNKQKGNCIVRDGFTRDMCIFIYTESLIFLYMYPNGTENSVTCFESQFSGFSVNVT